MSWDNTPKQGWFLPGLVFLDFPCICRLHQLEESSPRVSLERNAWQDSFLLLRIYTNATNIERQKRPIGVMSNTFWDDCQDCLCTLKILNVHAAYVFSTPDFPCKRNILPSPFACMNQPSMVDDGKPDQNCPSAHNLQPEL